MSDARPRRSVRCAIYTRVSTDAGLEQEFNSLEAQYDASQAYIRSQAHAGWTLIKARYDDGGFSSGSTERPALQQLLADWALRLSFWKLLSFVLLFGRKLVPPWAHFIAALMVAIGTLFSSFWILSANSWMQTPAGYEIINGQFFPTC